MIKQWRVSYTIILILLIPISVWLIIYYQEINSESHTLDKGIQELVNDGKFSGVVLVANDDHPILEKAYGMANYRNHVANQIDTLFCIASMGKMFTGVAITQLAQNHQLSFDDHISKYISGFPSSIGDRVTLAELLTHTSGMGDIALSRHPDHQTQSSTLTEQLTEIKKQPLQFLPGSRHSYSNDGYIVLGAVIEKVSGMSYENYIATHIFQPADMHTASFGIYQPSKVPNMAVGYYTKTPYENRHVAYIEFDEPQIANPSGGAYASVKDMYKFAIALKNHTLLNSEYTAIATTGKVKTMRTGNNNNDTYAYGFNDRHVKGARIIGHNGGNPGYEGQLDIYIDKGSVVIVLANLANSSHSVIESVEHQINFL
jgi:CubicO group peptidase (beta-lactamase class C family)